MRRVLLACLMAVLGLGLCAQPALALLDEDYALSIYPATQTISLNPGEEYSGKVEVANSGQKPFTLKVSAAPYSVDSETYTANLESRGDYTLLCDWISFEHDTFYVEPDQSAQVEFTVKVPEDVVGGGQYAAIVARTDESVDTNATVQVVPEIVGLLYGRINGAEMDPGGELIEHHIPHWIFDGPLTVSETVENVGNVDFQVYHAMKVKDFFTGKEVVRAESENENGQVIGSVTQVVFPDTVRENTLKWEAAPKLGIYRVEQTILFLEREFKNEQIVIICPLWLLVSVIVLLVLLILWIVLIIRRRRHRQPQVL